MNELDLHGIPHEQALRLVEDFVFRESQNGIEWSCKIITGNSNTLQGKIIYQVLDEFNFRWYIPSWNGGVIIVN